METTTYEVLGVIVITGVAVCGKLIESARPFILTSLDRTGGNGFLETAYECFNVHLHLSLGMLGLLWTQRAGPEKCLFLILLVLAGVLIKGIFSCHKPDRLTLSDKDALRGLYLPNACALACVFFVVFQLHMAAAERKSPAVVDTPTSDGHQIHTAASPASPSPEATPHRDVESPNPQAYTP